MPLHNFNLSDRNALYGQSIPSYPIFPNSSVNNTYQPQLKNPPSFQTNTPLNNFQRRRQLNASYPSSSFSSLAPITLSSTPLFYPSSFLRLNQHQAFEQSPTFNPANLYSYPPLPQPNLTNRNLSFILVAILMLLALDLIFVRPQKYIVK